MSATEKYRPKTLKDIVGNQSQIRDLVNLFLAHKREGSIPKVMIQGPPGCGKTTAVRALATHMKSFKFRLLETNASDARRKNELYDIIRHSRTKPFTGNWLIFLDEVEGVKNWSLIHKLIDGTQSPLILVANDAYKIPAAIKKKLTKIQFFQPYLNLVVERLHEIQKREKRPMDFSSTTQDVRQSINALVYGGENYKPTSNPFIVVQDVFVYHDLSSYDRDEHLIWLLDNVHNLYQGKDLLEAMEILSLHAETGFDEVLEMLPTGKATKEDERPIKYPFFKRRLKVLWSKKKK